MKKQFFLGACLVALATPPILAQSAGPDIIMVRVAENHTHAHLIIERPDRAAEVIDFDWSEKLAQTPSKGYYSAFAKLFADGYRVEAIIPGTTYAGGSMACSTLLFARHLATGR